MQAPVMVMNTNSKRESGRKAQITNIQAAKVSFPSRRLCLLPSTCPIYLGRLRNRHFNPRTPIHAQDVAGSHGRNRYDQRWVRIDLLSNAILR